MRKIYVLEHFDFSVEQMDRLKSLGEVKCYEKVFINFISDTYIVGCACVNCVQQYL